MGDQEHCEADGQQSADGDQPEGAFATGGGQLNALAVFHDGGGGGIGVSQLFAGCGRIDECCTVAALREGAEF